MKLKKVNRKDGARQFTRSLAELMPPAPLSSNPLHDIYTRLSCIDLYIKECLCREMCWTEEEFDRHTQPPTPGNPALDDFYLRHALAIIKIRLNLFLQYVDISRSMTSTMIKGSSKSTFGTGRTKDQKPTRLPF